MTNKKKQKHIAIILDGNRRWARKRGLPAIRGHEYGAKAFEKIIKHCVKTNIKHLTVYAFSTENWKRTKIEVRALITILKKYLQEYAEELNEQGVCFRIFGDQTKFPKPVQKEIERAINLTKKNKKMNLNICLSYGARNEIVHAMKQISKKRIPSSKINEKIIEKHLYSAGQPDPDMIIRTGGELRLSNFLLWQAAYSELIFVKKYWPDYKPADLDNAISVWQKRQRRYGG